MDDLNKNEFFESKMTDDKATTAADANDALLDEIDEFDDDEYEIVLEEIFDDDVAPAEQPTAQESEETPLAESAEETAPAKEEQAPAEEKPAEAHPAVKSDTISPYKLGKTKTSNFVGSCTSCIQRLSTKISFVLICG